MALRARYHPSEDRMLLVVSVGQEDTRFWVTRSLWLALYDQLARLSAADDKTIAPLPRSIEPSSNQTQRSEVTLLQGVRWKRHLDSVTIVFRSDKPSISLTLQMCAVSRVCRMLESLADRAAWDIAAACERLQADQVANAVVRRARS